MVVDEGLPTEQRHERHGHAGRRRQRHAVRRRHEGVPGRAAGRRAAVDNLPRRAADAPRSCGCSRACTRAPTSRVPRCTSTPASPCASTRPARSRTPTANGIGPLPVEVRRDPGRRPPCSCADRRAPAATARHDIGWRHGLARRALRRLPPAGGGREVRTARVPRPLRLRARRVPARGLPRARGRARRAGGGARPARARRSSASSPCTWPCAPGRKCFYTTPIKALSNQKYADLVARYGADKVGLLTGDNSINGEAPGGRDDHRGAAQHALRRVAHPAAGSRYVVMDEVHYLADRFRGAVWEEVILHLPEHVAGGRAVGDGEQRRGVRRLARRRCAATPRSSSTSTGRCRCGST